MAAGRTPLPALTGLRFVAALAVAGSHLPFLYYEPATGGTARRFLAEGFVGVPFFFVLSGFVLAYSYHDRFPSLGGGRLRVYLAARTARIGPVHWLTLGVAALWPVLGPGQGTGLGAAVYQVFLVHAWSYEPRVFTAYNSVSWSLSVEATFYLLLPGVLWLLARRPRLGPMALLALAAGVWLAELAVVAWCEANLSGKTLWLANICPGVRFGEFLVGVLVGLAAVRGGWIDRERSWRGTLAELAAVIGLGVLVFHSFRVPMLYRYGVYYTPAMAVLVAVFARQAGRLSALLSNRPAVYLGEISYAYYMVHCLVFTGPMIWFGPITEGTLPWAAGLLVAAGVVAAGVHHLVEAPLRRRLTRWLRDGARVPAARVPQVLHRSVPCPRPTASTPLG